MDVMKKQKRIEPHHEMTLRECTSLAGKAAAAKLTPEQRSEKARKASNARWAKRKNAAAAA